MTASVELRAVLRDEISAALKSISETTKQTGASAQSAGRSLGVLEDETEKLSSSLQDNIIKLRAQRDLLKDPAYQASARQAAALKREVDELNAGLKQGTREGDSNAMTWAGLVSKYYLAAQAIGAVKNATMSLVEASSKYELLQARLTSVEGSSALGMRDFKEVQELAKKPGLGFEEAASTFATLRGMKVTAAEAKTLINGIAQANASAAGTAEQFGRVMYQIQQSVSLGRLMAEDLRPIQTAIPTLGAAMQEHFGANQAEQLNKILEKSGKSVREFWLEVAELGSKLPSTGETIANNLDNISDGWVRLRASLTNTEAVKTATSLLAKFLEKSSQVMEGVSERKSLRARAEASIGKRSIGYAPAGIDLEGLQGGGDEAAIQAEMIRLRQADAIKAINDEYDKEEKEEADRRRVARENRIKSEQEKANSDAKKLAESERKRMERHRLESEKNVIFSGPNEVTMRDSGAPDPVHLQNRAKAEEKRDRDERAALDERVRRQKEYTKLIDDENRKRIESDQAYWRQVQAVTTNALNNIAQTFIMQSGSLESKMESLLSQAGSALISNGIAMFVGGAFAPATGGASLAPGGMGLLGDLMGVPRRASGGQVFGGFIGNENARSGGEYFRANVPGRVYNTSQQTTNNIGGPTININVSGGNARGNAREIAKVIPRALALSAANRSQTSRA